MRMASYNNHHPTRNPQSNHPFETPSTRAFQWWDDLCSVVPSGPGWCGHLAARVRQYASPTKRELNEIKRLTGVDVATLSRLASGVRVSASDDTLLKIVLTKYLSSAAEIAACAAD